MTRWSWPLIYITPVVFQLFVSRWAGADATALLRPVFAGGAAAAAALAVGVALVRAARGDLGQH